MVNEHSGSARESSLASGWTVEGQPGPQDAADQVDSVEAASSEAGATALDPSGSEEASHEPREQLPAAALVVLGLIGGVYLLYTFVWFSWANYYSVTNSLVAQGSGSLGGVLQQIVFWIAPLAPAMWFVTVLVMARESRLSTRLVWLLVGAIVLLPLPMFGGVS